MTIDIDEKLIPAGKELGPIESVEIDRHHTSFPKLVVTFELRPKQPRRWLLTECPDREPLGFRMSIKAEMVTVSIREIPPVPDGEFAEVEQPTGTRREFPRP